MSSMENNRPLPDEAFFSDARDYCLYRQALPILGQAKQTSSLVKVSGIPLIMTNPDILYRDSLYNDNLGTKLEGLVGLPGLVSLVDIKGKTHKHLDGIFLGAYGRVWLTDPETDTEYLMGIRSVLGFEIEVVG